MPKYIMELVNTTTYELEIEAESVEHAYELTAEWGRDELEDDITDNKWDIQIWEG